MTARRLTTLLLLAVAGGCDARGTARVTVDATGVVRAVDHLQVRVTDDREQSASFLFDLPDRPADLPPPVSFSLSFNAGYSGAIDVTVTAADLNNAPLSSDGHGTISPGHVAAITVTLPGEVNADLSGTNDLSKPGAPDLSQLDLSAPDLSSTPDMTVLPKPVVLSASPSSGPTTGGTAMSITGQNFFSGATVSLGGTRATNVVFVSSTTLGVTLPPSTKAGLVPVTVTNPDGQSGSNGGIFSYFFGVTRFAAAPTPPVGGSATAVALADLNGDGRDDVVVASSNAGGGNGDVEVLISKTMTAGAIVMPPVSYPAGTNPTWVATADLNHDGNQDVVVTNSGSGDVSVLLGKGDGTLKPAVPHHTGNGTNFVALADVSGDTLIDAVVTNPTDGTVAVLIGDGLGGFASPAPYPVGVLPDCVAIADFTGDHKLDLAVGNQQDNFISILVAQGNGLFAPGTNIANAPWMQSLVAVDFNHDGAMDIAGASGLIGFVQVFKGIGNGAFQFASDTGQSFSGTLASADFNHDLLPDLVISQSYIASVNVAFGLGDASFINALTLGTGDGPYAVAVGDLNGDGLSDIVTGDGDGTVALLLADGTNGFLAAANYNINTVNPVNDQLLALQAGKVDGDLFPDLVVANAFDASIATLLGTGTGSFGTPIVSSLNRPGSRPTSLVLDDLNHDGKLDAIVIGEPPGGGFAGFISVLLGDGAGHFTVKSSFDVSAAVWAVTAGELTGDGNQDFAVARFTQTVNAIDLYPGVGDGTFGPVVNPPPPTARPRAIIAARLHGVNLDLVTVNDDAKVNVFLSSGSGGFAAPNTYPVGSSFAFYDLIAADFSGDGVLDLVVLNRGAGTVSFLQNFNGGGFLPAQTTGALPQSVQELAAADFNLDGVIEFATVSLAGGPGLLSRFGFGSLPLFTSIGGEGGLAIVTADFDLDQKPDIAIVSQNAYNVSVLLNRSF